ncbi:MAG: tRNA pseudouridine(13) synthase TruD [Phycisphaerales bacterium]|nr:tRNA pseudouridine(13) synthase TruD [Phycisphaerales bacterium]
MTIRRVPTDFRVDEIATAAFRESLRPAADARALFAVYRLQKTSLSTPEATARLAKALTIKPGDVSHAGLKDKHAHTTQHVSARARDLAAAARFAPEITAPGVHATLAGWSSAPTDASIIESNHFEIIIRGLSRETSDRMARHARALTLIPDSARHRKDSTEHVIRRKDSASPASASSPLPIAHSPLPLATPSLLFTNYFGEQRFGSARHGQGFAAAHLIRGDFDTALNLLIATPARKDTGARRAFTRAAATHWGQWNDLLAAAPPSPHRRAIEVLASGGSFADAFASLPMIDQRLCVDAYQSWLWNHAAAELLRESLAATPDAMLDLSTDHGPLVFARADAVPPSLGQLIAPLPRKAASLDGDWARAVARVLSRESLNLDQLEIPTLRRPRFDPGDRPLFAPASNFSLSKSSPDEFAKGRLARTARFDLPSGSYATIVLRALGQ